MQLQLEPNEMLRMSTTGVAQSEVHRVEEGVDH